MKTSEALAIVKTHLSTDDADWKRDTYICHATDEVAWQISYEMADKIKAHVNMLLDGSYSFDTWLARNHGDKVRSLQATRGAAYRNKMQVTRHAWIDHMIKEFRAKGD